MISVKYLRYESASHGDVAGAGDQCGRHLLAGDGGLFPVGLALAGKSKVLIHQASVEGIHHCCWPPAHVLSAQGRVLLHSDLFSPARERGCMLHVGKRENEPLLRKMRKYLRL